MIRTILITSDDDISDEYALRWHGTVATLEHSYGNDLIAGLLDETDTLAAGIPVVVSAGRVTMDFGRQIGVTETYHLKMVTFMPKEDQDYVLGEYYSGPVENILAFCKSLNVSGDRLIGLDTLKIERMQRLVDDYIDETLGEYYFTPLVPFNQVQRDGSLRKAFPGKVRLMAIQWTAGLLLQTEFQNMEPNVNEQASRFVEDARKEFQQMLDYSTRIPGQRRKHPSPTMPPNLAPSKTAQWL